MLRRLRIVICVVVGAAIVTIITGPLAAAPSPTSSQAWVDDLSPIPATAWNAERAAHLLDRAGFGGTPEDIARLASMTPQQAVESLVDYERIDDTGVAFEESGIWDRGMDPFPPSRADAVRQAREHGEALGVHALADGSQRRLQPVVDKFFYGLRANTI